MADLSEEYRGYRGKSVRQEPGRVGSERWAAVYDWYTTSGREEFLAAFHRETGISIGRNSNADALVASALPRSLQDFENKLRGKAYYRAHGQWFLEEMDHICASVPRAETGPLAESIYADLMHFVDKVLFGSLFLFAEWGAVNDRPDLCRLGRNPENHVIHFFQGARQAIY